MHELKMKLLGLLLSLCFTVVRCKPTVRDAHGRGVVYEGIYKDEVETFLGIRYAQDTGGENRFRPPQSYLPQPGCVIQADDAGPACPQQRGDEAVYPLYLGNITEISEDCLRLNIARPNGTTASSKLPVMVFIHGGSFIASSKDEPLIQPGGLIVASVDNGLPVMHVSMNYRLGVFGFAQSSALHAEGSENAGVRDQRTAIEWVKSHIAAFGGDPDKITIHGQSSGGLAVGIQILAFGASKPAPFHRAIAQSQVIEAGITGNYTRNAMQRLANATGCNTSDLQTSATVACLRNRTMSELVNAQTKTHMDGVDANIGDEWLPVVDGDFLPAAPSTLLSTGRFYNVTTIIGWCEDDTNPFLDPTMSSNATGVRETFREFLPGFQDDEIDYLLSLYPVTDFHTSYFQNGSVKLDAQFYRAGRILRDIVMTCQPVAFSKPLIMAGNDVYFYTQNQTILTPILDTVGLYGYGVVHTSEFAYMFGNLSHYKIDNFPYHPRPKDFVLKDKETRSWSSFAALGRPSVEGKNTLQGWGKADLADQNFGIYVIGGPDEGYSGPQGRAASRSIMALEKLQQRCAYLNTPERIVEQGY